MKTAPEKRPPYNPDDVSLREAISLAQQGDGSAFELLYRLHSKRVYALCLHMVGVASEAEEFTQEAFLQVFRKIHTFRGESAFFTWFHRLTVNVVLMSLRKRKALEVSMHYQAEQEKNPGVWAREPGAADPALSGLFDRENLSRALRQMPAGYKRMLVLHDV